MTQPTPELDDLDALVQDLRDHEHEWSWDETRQRISRFATKRAAEAVDRARPILGDTAIRHAGTVHSHSGPCKPDCPATPPPGDAGERARAIVDVACRTDDAGRETREVLIEEIAAAIQSERTAAASQERTRFTTAIEHWRQQVGKLHSLVDRRTRERDEAASQARRETVEQARAILLEEGWLGRSEQRIADLADEMPEGVTQESAS